MPPTPDDRADRLVRGAARAVIVVCKIGRAHV